MTLVHQSLAFIQFCLSLLRIEDIFAGVIMLGFIPTYYRQLEQVYQVYKKHPPVHGQAAPDVAPVWKFMRQYMEECRYTMYSSIAIIWAIVINLNLAVVRVDIQKHFLLQVLALLSTTHAAASLYLSLVFMDSLSVVVLSYGYTLTFVEKALAVSQDKWLHTAVIFATPPAFNASAILLFAAYRIVSGLFWILDSRGGDTYAGETDAERYWALAVVVYMVFVIVQTALCAKIFKGLKDYVPNSVH